MFYFVLNKIKLVNHQQIHHADETNLMRGVGKPCAWHNNAKLSCSLRTNILIFESDGNVGALAPTGSVMLTLEKNQIWFEVIDGIDQHRVSSFFYILILFSIQSE